jgi:hypothetical protein
VRGTIVVVEGDGSLGKISKSFDLRSEGTHHFADCSVGIVHHCCSRRTARPFEQHVQLPQQWHHFQRDCDLRLSDYHL